MHTFKNIAIVTTLLGLISLSFIQKKSLKMNRLLHELNGFYPTVTDNEGRLSIEKCKHESLQIDYLNDRIAKVSLQRTNEAMQKMFFVHAYNLHVLDKINKNYPVTDIETISDFYDGESFTISKGQYTLRSLREFLIFKYKDPRVLFSLYYGGDSSPPLSFPKEKHHYDKLLELRTRMFINDPLKVRIKPKSHLVLLPEFMKWFMADFGISNSQDFLGYVNQYLDDEKLTEDYEVKFYPYSWKLD